MTDTPDPNKIKLRKVTLSKEDRIAVLKYLNANWVGSKDNDRDSEAVSFCFDRGVPKAATIKLLTDKIVFGDEGAQERQTTFEKKIGDIFDGFAVEFPHLFGSESNQFRHDPYDFSAASFARSDAVVQGWLVPNFIPDDDLTLYNGDGGSGKTTTALQLAVAIATGGKWLGVPTVAAAPVVFVSLEERPAKVKMRLAAILRSEFLGWDDIANLRVVTFEDEQLLAEKDDGGMVPTENFGILKSKIQQYRPRAFIIDSLVDSFGGDENNRAQVRQFVSMLRGLTSDTCAGIVLGHPSVAGLRSGKGTSGSTGWRNAFRSMLYVVIRKGIHTIECEKATMVRPMRA